MLHMLILSHVHIRSHCTPDKLRATSKSHVHKAIEFDEGTLAIREASFIGRGDLTRESAEEAPFVGPEAIVYLREKLGLTQGQLAEEIGTTKQSIINWEGDKSAPQAKYRKRLAKLQEQAKGKG